MTRDTAGSPVVRFDEAPAFRTDGATTDFRATSDGRHVYWIELLQDGRQSVVYDGVAGKPFDRLMIDPEGQPVQWFSPDGRRMAYSAQRADRFFIGVDGGEHPEFEALSSDVDPTFSPDGGHLAYCAFVAREPRLVVDGEVASGPGVVPIAPAFSDDGVRLAYAVQEGVGTAARQQMIVDGVPGPWHTQILCDPEADVRPKFSPDGRRFAYEAADEGRVRVVVDGEPGPALLGALFPTFSPDGQRFVYAGQFEDGWSLIEHGREGPRLWLVVEPIFSPDSRRLAYGALYDEERKVVFVDGVAGSDFTDIWAPVVFSSDSRRVAYLGQRRSKGILGSRTKWYPVVDAGVGAEFDGVSSPATFSPDGARVAFSAARGRNWHVVVDGEPGPAFRETSTPSFSSSGRLGYAATSDRGSTVVVDHVSGPLADLVGSMSSAAAMTPFAFSPDGRVVAWVGSIAGAWHPVVGEAVGPGYGAVSDPVFLDDRTALFWAAREGEIVRVTASLG